MEKIAKDPFDGLEAALSVRRLLCGLTAVLGIRLGGDMGATTGEAGGAALRRICGTLHGLGRRRISVTTGETGGATLRRSRRIQSELLGIPRMYL